MFELHRITLNVLVDRDREDSPDKWDWSDLCDSWAVPASDSEVISTWPSVDAFRDALDNGEVS